jgi:hypothetical protein
VPAVVEANDLTVECHIEPMPPVVGAPMIAEVRLRDRARELVRGATLRVEGHMAHPGMAAVIANAVEQADGSYQAELRLTMSGDWILIVTGSLPDGRRLNYQVDVAHARPAG